jgi:hypothetical protein
MPNRGGTVPCAVGVMICSQRGKGQSTQVKKREMFNKKIRSYKKIIIYNYKK